MPKVIEIYAAHYGPRGIRSAKKAFERIRQEFALLSFQTNRSKATPICADDGQGDEHIATSPTGDGTEQAKIKIVSIHSERSRGRRSPSRAEPSRAGENRQDHPIEVQT